MSRSDCKLLCWCGGGGLSGHHSSRKCQTAPLLACSIPQVRAVFTFWQLLLLALTESWQPGALFGRGPSFLLSVLELLLHRAEALQQSAACSSATAEQERKGEENLFTYLSHFSGFCLEFLLFVFSLGGALLIQFPPLNIFSNTAPFGLN